MPPDLVGTAMVWGPRACLHLPYSGGWSVGEGRKASSHVVAALMQSGVTTFGRVGHESGHDPFRDLLRVAVGSSGSNQGHRACESRRIPLSYGITLAG